MRNANIGLAVGIAILIVGVVLFRHSGDGPLQTVELVSLVAAFVVFHFLDERERRRNRSQ
jgi:NhaP-type Na+/H+ or K+/H+ antiporter